MNPTATLENKIKDCKQVIIQNIEKSIKKEMVYKYLKDNKIFDSVSHFNVNGKDAYIVITFKDHQKALEFYEKVNFKDAILLRTLNVYFNLQLNDSDMKKYEFDGANQNNIRKFFEIIRKIGICKVYTSYTLNNKLKPKGMVSFIRNDQIPQGLLKTVKNELKNQGITFNSHTPDKGLKCSVMLSNFYEGNLDKKEEQIEEESKKNLTEKFVNILGKVDGMSITPIVRRKQVADPDSEKGLKIQTKVRALLEFQDFDSTINYFEKIRTAFVKQPQARAVLNFHNSENNSYISLFTIGLVKPQKHKNITDRQFEDILVNLFRKVNQNVVQVTLFPLTYNNSFVGRIYLKDELSGKRFIAEYPNKRDLLIEFFKSQNFIIDINVDDKTQKKIKMIQRKVNLIAKNIKIANDMERKERTRKPANHQPLGQHMMPPGIPAPMGMPINMRMGSMPPNMPANIPPNMAPAMGMGGMPPVNMAADMKMKINKIIQDRNKIINDATKNQKAIKQFLSEPLRFVLESQLNLSKSQAGIKANNILQKNDVSAVIDFIENPRGNENML